MRIHTHIDESRSRLDLVRISLMVSGDFTRW
jgi:hypothetical protein